MERKFLTLRPFLTIVAAFEDRGEKKTSSVRPEPTAFTSGLIVFSCSLLLYFFLPPSLTLDSSGVGPFYLFYL